MVKKSGLLLVFFVLVLLVGVALAVTFLPFAARLVVVIPVMAFLIYLVLRLEREWDEG